MFILKHETSWIVGECYIFKLLEIQAMIILQTKKSWEWIPCWCMVDLEKYNNFNINERSEHYWKVVWFCLIKIFEYTGLGNWFYFNFLTLLYGCKCFMLCCLVKWSWLQIVSRLTIYFTIYSCVYFKHVCYPGWEHVEDMNHCKLVWMPGKGYV